MKSWHSNLLCVFFGLLLAAAILIVARKPQGKPIEILPPPTPSPLMVHIAGEVNHPGLYEVSPECRVDDLITLAGGFTAEADQAAVNLASRVLDGQKILVPSVLPAAEAGSEGDPMTTSTDPNKLPLLNINFATQQELESLPGIGPTRAKAIIDYREKNGSFLVIEDLMKVNGIGSGTFELLKNSITTR